MPLATYNNQWQENDYIRYRVAEAKERSMSDLREQVLRQKLAKQRQTVLIIGLVGVVLGLCLLFVYLYRRRQRLLLEKEEEIETLRNMLASAYKPDDKESVRKLMLQQLGIIKTIAGTPTEANQHLLSRLMALNEDTAAALIDWQSIYQTIDLVYDGFYSRLQQRFADVLNEKELQLCCLLASVGVPAIVLMTPNCCNISLRTLPSAGWLAPVLNRSSDLSAEANMFRRVSISSSFSKSSL